MPWIDRLMPGTLPDVPPSNPQLVSRQHPDHDTPERM